ncbi:nicotinate-nucleotide adenylyltransferase [Bacillus ectoiniformans]|uniref:nicotinate-nucleotide adenylyltransferase n=1 Tax=Bacillus ectoiniformans TaxID=1494429 RepID=UPI00195BC872|nr:nicotinate-nucleotide adenylyltransferase [Bacillus ectoiniformans]MBM7649966.1 nicotinate-nucleotide adenylyltransferase [Bacillus ectoiniformans]
MNRKVGILGGTFNPPHTGHLIIANEVLCALALDEVRFMPNHTPPHKEMAKGVSNEDRVRMIEAAIQGHPHFSVETIELQREGSSYTYDTIRLLKEQEPETDFYFIIGGDMIDYLPKWHKIEELIEIVTFIGVRRPGYLAESSYPLTMVDIPEINLSSTIIRKRAATGETLRYLLPDGVIDYIKENQLYGSRASFKDSEGTDH